MAYDAENFPLPTIDPLTITEPKERLRYLAEFLRGLSADSFDMQVYGVDGHGEEITDVAKFHVCGSAACICGWAIVKFGIDAKLDDDDAGGTALGLGYDQAFRLFIPEPRIRATATPTQAADVLDHLRLTGEVSWEVARSVSK